MVSNINAWLYLDHILTYSFDEILITSASGDILYASNSTKAMFGITTNAPDQQNVFTLEKEGVFSPSVIVKVLRTHQQETILQETVHGRKNIITGYPVKDEMGKVVGAISFSRDVTEFEQLKKRNEQIAAALTSYQEEIRKLKKQVSHSAFSYKGEMARVYDMVSKISDLDITVLLEGESGVGKNHIARSIHQFSKRKDEAFVEVNCGAIPESLIDSELFGYEEGAFTGAKKGGRKGYFEAARQGTLFLDEITELPMNLQVKLLSVLQNQSIKRVGGMKEIQLKCRIICATNQDIEALVKTKQFREDLYYRINVVKINVPPLRERKEEIVPLIYHIIDEMNQKHGMNKQFSAAMIAWLSQQKWPGNVRELRNYIEKVIVVSNSEVIEMDEHIRDYQKPQITDLKEEMCLKDYLENAEREYITRMYQKYPSSIQLGKKLGISQPTANRKIRKYIDKT